MVVIGQKCFYSGKVVIFGGKRGCIRGKVVVFWQGGFIRAKWL